MYDIEMLLLLLRFAGGLVVMLIVAYFVGEMVGKWIAGGVPVLPAENESRETFPVN